MVTKVSLVAIALFLIVGCKNNIEQPENGIKGNFGIYHVDSNKSAISYGKVGDKYVEPNFKVVELDIVGEPIITEEQIKMYHWKTQRLELKEEYVRKITDKEKFSNEKKYTGSRYLGAKDDQEVVIIINGHKLYSAGFLPHQLRSWFAPSKMIIDEKNCLKIIANDNQIKDIENKAIYDFFKSVGKLSEES